MIDIYGSGPFIRITELLAGSLQEMGSYFFHFILSLIIVLLLKRLSSGRIQTISAFLPPLAQIVYLYSISIKTEFVFSLCLAVIITLQLWLLQLLPLHALDYAFFFSAMLFPGRLFNNTSALLGNLWIFWILYCTLAVTVKIGAGGFKGNHFSCYFLFIILSSAAYTYHVAGVFLPTVLSAKTGNHAFSLICSIALMALLILLLTCLVKKKFYNQLIRLNHFGRKYSKTELYFSCFTVTILLLITLIFIPFTVLRMHNALLELLIPCLCLALLWAQMPFILLLYQAAFYKDHATYYEWEKEGLATYYEGLSNSITAMQDMRHDIKNIFFTMGNFVDRSSDTELKEFFWEKIYPYSLETIRQSELFSKLYQIPAESLRAFFTLKISQAFSHRIAVTLEISILPETFQPGLDIIDLTRILGILLDNAIEETMQAPDKTIGIKITANAAGCSYLIKNPVTADTLKTGIHAGQSTKGTGRGKGLLIVNQILEQYHNTILNSSVQGLTYLQCLNICNSEAR